MVSVCEIAACERVNVHFKDSHIGRPALTLTLTQIPRAQVYAHRTDSPVRRMLDGATKEIGSMLPKDAIGGEEEDNL